MNQPLRSLRQNIRGWEAGTVLLAALGLRLFQIGRQSFWNDEAGEVLAAVQPTLRGTVDILQGHVMAMPLDYFVARLFASIHLSEAVLRLPSAVWGSLGVLVSYWIARHVVGREELPAGSGPGDPAFRAWFIPLLAGLILAFSVPLIYYAQEVRFYAALFFFYSLATLLALKSLSRPGFVGWAGYFAAMTLGAYFHPYVLFAALNGLAWAALVERSGRRLFQLAAASAAAGLAFLPGFLYFGESESHNRPILEFNASFFEVIGQAFGWIRVAFSPAVPLLGGWETLTLLLFGLGVLAAARGRDRRLAALLLGMVLQVGFIYLLNWYRGYWFIYRQIIHLSAVPALFSAAGAAWLVEWIRLRSKTPLSAARAQRWSAGLLVLVLLAAAVPGLAIHYGQIKSNARAVVEALLEREQGSLLVIPAYEDKIYYLYLTEIYRAAGWAGKVQAATWNTIGGEASEQNEPTYLAVPANLTADQLALLAEKGFVPVLHQGGLWSGERALFVRE